MNLQYIDPRELSPNPWNTNEVGPANMEKLVASLRRHGWVKPVLAREVDGSLQILGGQHRVEASIELKHDTVPVLVLDDVSDARAKEIGLIDNARYGDDDIIGLSELLNELGGADFMSDFLPIGAEEIASLSTELGDDDIDDLLNDDEAEKPEAKPERPAKTHNMMRFKVPIADADAVSDAIEEIMEEQGFTEADSLTNAGDALVYLINKMRKEIDA